MKHFILLNSYIFLLYLQQKQLDIAWLLRTALKTVQKASEYKLLFQYMPEFYLEIVIYAHNALKNYFQPYMPFDSLPGMTFSVSETYFRFLQQQLLIYLLNS